MVRSTVVPRNCFFLVAHRNRAQFRFALFRCIFAPRGMLSHSFPFVHTRRHYQCRDSFFFLTHFAGFVLLTLSTSPFCRCRGYIRHSLALSRSLFLPKRNPIVCLLFEENLFFLLLFVFCCFTFFSLASQCIWRCWFVRPICVHCLLCIFCSRASTMHFTRLLFCLWVWVLARVWMQHICTFLTLLR